MKKQLCGLAVSMLLLSGCTQSASNNGQDQSLEKDLDKVKYQLLELQKQLDKTTAEVNQNKKSNSRFRAISK
jgi:hypothetical protein